MHELRDITLCILFAWVLGLLAHFFRQPLILAYLIAGFLIGPFGMGWVKSRESVSIISELGLIFMQTCCPTRRISMRPAPTM
jgi:Kef-type K+ transport system membrane component KefB